MFSRITQPSSQNRTQAIPNEEDIRKFIKEFAITDSNGNDCATVEQATPVKKSRTTKLFGGTSSYVYDGYSTVTTTLTAINTSPISMSKVLNLKLSQLIPNQIIQDMKDMGAYQFSIGDLKITQMLTPNSADVSGILETDVNYASEIVRYVQPLGQEETVDFSVEYSPLSIDTPPGYILGEFGFKVMEAQISATGAGNDTLKLHQFFSVQAQFDLNVASSANSLPKNEEITPKSFKI